MPFARRLKAIIWLKWRCGALAKRDGVDVFWGTATLLPRLPKSVRTLVTVYDLNYLLAPESMIGTHKIAHRLFFRRDVLRADIVTAISQGTADRIFKHHGREADAVVPPATDGTFRPVPGKDAWMRLKALGVDAPYILGVATWEPRKNLGMLIQVFLQLKARGRLGNRKLVLAGGRGWKEEKLIALLAQASEDRRKDILPLGFVADSDLPTLYSACDAFVFPSLYEGFGMPVLEARACGAKVLATDIPELREAGGTDSHYIQPTFDGLSRGLIEVLASPGSSFNPDGSASWEAGAEVLGRLLQSPRGK
ncbi:MAG TPA: glycosyltransferase family 1 protein [Fibrobacteria bacterium]|nr:glycosyltransferase family 1 protein [Fibrobacteria bacterium]